MALGNPNGPKPKTPPYAANALQAGADETDLLPGDRPRAVRVKPPPIQGSEATTTYVGPPRNKEGTIEPEVDHRPKLISPKPTPPPTGGTKRPAAQPPAAPAPPNNNVVIRQWNLNRGIPNEKMQWNPATQALLMDNRPVFQVGRNMWIDAQGNGVTDQQTWRNEMERYGYGEQANSNIPSNQRDLMNGALTTLHPKEYWASALGQEENQRILKDRDNAMIAARQAAQARGASLDSGTFARLQGNVIGTEEQARIDAAPKLMEATRRSYLDILNSDIAARTGQNAQEIAEANATGIFRGAPTSAQEVINSNATGMWRGAPTYGTQQDAFNNLMKIAAERETMPNMDPSVMTHPGMLALADQLNAIAGNERYTVTNDRLMPEITRENNLLDDTRAQAEAKSKDWTDEQRKLYNTVHAWATSDPNHKVPLNAAGFEAAKEHFGAPPNMSGKQATEVLETLFGGGKAGTEPTRAEVLDGRISTLTGIVLKFIPNPKLKIDLDLNPPLKEKVTADVLAEVRAQYSTPEGRKAMEPLSLAAAEEMAKEILRISKTTTDGIMIQRQILGNQGKE